MKNKIALEEHFAIEGTKKYKNDVMDAPTFAEVNRRLFDTESLRLEAMDKAGIELSILSFNSPGIQAETDPAVAVQAAKRANDFLCEKVIARHPIVMRALRRCRCKTLKPPRTSSSAVLSSSASKVRW